MKTPACNRTWEAEAVGDGRLDPMARASFERHAATCAACSEQVRLHARLQRAMRDLPQYAIQPLDRRRLRIALMQRANRQLMRSDKPRRGQWVFVAVCASTLVAAVAGAGWWWRQDRARGSVHTPSFEIVDLGNASWTTATSGNTAHVRLSVGTTAVHVEHLMQDERFLVELPDGELEVRGTRFQVSVADRRTTRLEVSEGVVALRLVGRAEIILTAGQEWTLPTPVVANSGMPSAVETPPLNPPAPTAQAISRTIARAPVPGASVAGPPPAPPSTADAPAPGEALPVVDSYEICIRAFESGDYSGADRLLETFEQEHPSDARGEDAAFLRAVCHSRMGDSAGAGRLASDYLQRYPHGLRRREAERLAGGGRSSKP